MSYIGAQPTTAAFVTDTFSANGSGTVFTLSVAPANTNSILVAVSGVLQDPSTYSVSGTTLTFSAAPPAGTGNISVRFLGIPASGVVNTAYRTVTEFTATAGQTTFTPPSYTVGYINVYRNGALLGTADYTATNGTTVVLANPASLNDLVVVESFYVSSVLNAIPATAGAVTDAYITSMAGSKLTGTQSIPKTTLPTGSVLQVIFAESSTKTTQTSNSVWADINPSASITPLFSSSRILILTSFGVSNNSAGLGEDFQILRNSTVLQTYTNSHVVQTANQNAIKMHFEYVDSPATTSAITYKFQIRHRSGNSGTYVVNEDASGTVGAIPQGSQMILMEIAS